MILSCVMCGDPFSHKAGRGRPPSFCTPECRQDSSTDPWRICRGCGTVNHVSSMAFPAYCTAECKDRKSGSCMQCGNPTDRTQGRFCSGECVALHQGVRKCNTCDNPVLPPTHPPFNNMPRYCSETCRSGVMHARGYLQPRQMALAITYAEALSYLPTPLWHLPVRGTYRPYVIPAHLVPKLPPATPKLANSIAWWNYCIPKLHEWCVDNNVPPALVVAELGRTGWGGVDTPRGILPLWEVLPYVSHDAVRLVHMQTVRDFWEVAAARLPWNTAKIERTRDKLRELSQLYSTGADHATFKPDANGVTKFYRMITEYMEMSQPPAVERLYLPDHLAILQSDPLKALVARLDRVRRANGGKWQAVPYGATQQPPGDRLLDDLERILTMERTRMSKAKQV